MRLPLAELFQFVIAISNRYNIDESHSLGHSMRVMHNADLIAREESKWTHRNIYEEQKPVIQAAAILHDTCDKKYREEGSGLKEVAELLTSYMSPVEIDATIDIIGKMSYSKVIKTGMPNMGEYQTAFNIVREADLLDAYDFDRSIIYHMNRNGKSIEEAYDNACELFETRVLRHEQDGLLLTRYAKNAHSALAENAIKRMHHWRRILRR